MSVRVRIIDGPLGTGIPPIPLPPGVGARVVFEGIVRGEEDGRALRALKYDVYEPMATGMLETIGGENLAAHGLIAIHIEHSRGEVPVGACSFRLVVYAAHRLEALRAMDEFITRMKRDVPIWKVAVWA
jgi:molybdopterin synthase catalytic subunit